MNRSHTESYLQLLQEKLTLVLGQKEKIGQAASLLAETLKSDGWIYAFGTGHSHIFAEELFYRAGGFARVRPILDPDLMLHIEASASTEIERREGYAATLLSGYQISSNDVLILASNSGRNAVPIEMALLAKKAGAKTICLTNLKHSQEVSSRHSSSQKLYEICDVALDNFGEIGDAGSLIPGMDAKMGSTSTIIGSALLHAIQLETASLLLKSGHSPEIFHSSNTDEGEKANQKLIEKYKSQVKSL